MNGFQKTIAAVLLAAVLLFMIYLPKCAGKMLERDQYREWLEPEEEEFSGVINVWHVVGFKPYMGSVGAWLKKLRTERNDGISVFILRLNRFRKRKRNRGFKTENFRT